MAKQRINPQTIMNQKAANGWGTGISTKGIDFFIIQIATEENAEGILKCYGSSSNSEPTWANAAAVDNIYAAKYMNNLDSGQGVRGSTGVTLSGTDIIREYRINTDNMDWLNFNISNYNAGKFTVKIIGICKTRTHIA